MKPNSYEPRIGDIVKYSEELRELFSSFAGVDETVGTIVSIRPGSLSSHVYCIVLWSNPENETPVLRLMDAQDLVLLRRHDAVRET